MNKQHTRRRRAACRAAARTLAIAAAVAALAVGLGAGQALAGPDERVLERQGWIDRQAATGQADEQGKAEQPAPGPAEPFPRRYFQPEPPMDTGPRLDADEQVAPPPPPPDRDDAGPGLTGPAILTALVLALAAITTWRVRHGHPRPDATS